MFELCERTEELRRVPGVHRAVLRTVQRNASLLSCAEADASMFAVRKGVLKAVHTHADGRKRVCDVYVPGDLIPAELFAAGTSSMDVVAVTDAMVCELDRSTVAGICDLVPQSREAVNWLVARNSAPRKISDNRQCSARLDQFVKRISNRLRARGMDEIDVLAHLTRQDLADLLHSHRGAVSRAVKTRTV